jgi:RHS repeat-associated protein
MGGGFSKRLCTRLVALLIMVNLPMWPGLPIAGLLPVSAHSGVVFGGVPVGYLPFVVKALFWFVPTKPQREETLADRIAQVALLKVSPLKLVAYENQSVPFTALPINFAGETIQGVRVEWESSDPDRVDIDDSGQAVCLKPGLAIITCRAGLVTGIAAILVRPGRRPVQTDEEWRADQSAFRAKDIISGGAGDSGTGGLSANLFTSLVDKLMPTAYAQTQGYSNNDFPFDELYSESRNLVGSPRNRAIESTRTGTVLPEGSNFKMAIPIVGLGGRGLSASLTLNYNSRVWSRHGSAITFDAVESRPGPGFSIGFGRIIAYGPTNATRYLLVDADGTRRFLGVGGTRIQTVTVQTTDGSHITYTGNALYGGTLYFNDGTKVDINVINNRLLPWRITDSNGNYITIAFKSFYCDTGCQICDCPIYYPALTLDYVTDTMGRIIQFNYDSYNNLTSISAPGFGGTTQTLAQFDYQSSTISGNFSGLTVENKPAAAVNFIKHIRIPATGTGYLFSYSAFGMAYNISMRRQMTINGSVISDGVESATVALNYQTGSTPALTDAPAFTQRTESATNAPTALYSYATTTNGGLQTMTFTVTRPDSSTQSLTRSTNASSIANGLLVQNEIKNSTGGSMSKSVYDYANDSGGSPQVQAITSYDDTATPTKVGFDYDQYGNVTNNREYGFQLVGNWQVRRRGRTVYKTDSAYVNAYLRDRVIESDVYDAQLNVNDTDDVLIAKSTYILDDYNAMGGMENYGGPPTPPPGHLTSYNATYTLRGNVTGRTEVTDVNAGTSITWLRKLDIFGTTVKEQLSCCNEETVTQTQNHYWALPETVTKGAAGGPQLTTSTHYDFNTSLTMDTTDPNSQTTTINTRDAALRPTLITQPTGATASANYNDDTLSASRTVIYDDNGTQKQVTRSTVFDGWGQVIQSFNEHGGQINTSYDPMGRVLSRSNPFTAGGTPGPATSYQYDALGRAKQVTLPDSNTIQTTYSGTTVIVTDQVNRKIQRIADGLGRLVTVNEQNATGSLTQATSYTYNYLDQLTLVNQGNQTRSYKYDALSRLLYERIPEQTATINDGTGTFWSSKYAYTNFSEASTRQDARGVIATYGYDSLNRLTTVSYNTVSGVPTSPAVTYRYDTDSTYGTTATGKLVRVNVGSDYQERYTFDSYKRVASAVFTLGANTYTTSYEYNQRSQLTQAGHMGYSYDSAGRLNAVGSFYNASYNVAGQLTGDSLSSWGWNGSTLVDSVTAETFGYDANRMQLTSQTATTTNTNRPNQLCIPSCPPPPPGGTNLSLTYNYQATAGQMGAGTTAGNAGQLMSVTGTIGGVTESAYYAYDLLGRLGTSSQTSNGTYAFRKFAYDRWGNRTTVWDDPFGVNPIQSVTLEQSGGAPTNRITSVTAGSTVNYTYDAAGNVTSDGVHSYTYDSENRLVSVDGGSTAQYSYDDLNQRYKKTVGSTVTHYIWEDGKVLGEYNGSTGALQVNYWYAGERLFKKTGVITQVFLRDRLSVRLALSDIGVVAGRQGHLPFGEEFAESGIQDKHHFTSYETDPETGLDYAINRSHAPSSGRFQSIDPESTGTIEDPQTWHRYSYAINDPVNSQDPQGLDSVPVSPGGLMGPRQRLNASSAFTCTIAANFVPFLPLIGNYPGFYALWPRYVSYTAGPDQTLADGRSPGYWFYKFEVFIVYPGLSTIFDQYYFSVGVEEDDSWIGRNPHTGREYPFDEFKPLHDDAPEAGFWQSTAFSANFVDTPAFKKRQKRKVKKGGKTKLTPVSGVLTWTFTFQGFDALGTFFCEKKVKLTYTFAPGTSLWEWKFIPSG